jgi:CPA2 family monovalent cation:H+ antiporter-2
MGIGFIIASAFLVTAMLLVPLFKKIGMGSVLGYLFSGMIVSAILNTLSHQLGILNAPELIRQLGHMAEFGVILMLFIVGLEIHPQKLWKMKAEIFGLGSSQVLLTTLLLGSCCMAAGLPWQQALLIGMTFSLSSTAIAIQGLNEKKWDQKVGGKKSFSTLLLQD